DAEDDPRIDREIDLEHQLDEGPGTEHPEGGGNGGGQRSEQPILDQVGAHDVAAGGAEHLHDDGVRFALAATGYHRAGQHQQAGNDRQSPDKGYRIGDRVENAGEDVEGL